MAASPAGGTAFAIVFAFVGKSFGWWSVDVLCFRTRLGDPCLKTYPVECKDLIKRARTAFQAGRTLAESFRLAQLEAVVQMLEEHQCDLVDALGRDLHKVRFGGGGFPWNQNLTCLSLFQPRFETIVSELILVKNEALYAIDNLRKWMQPQRLERNLVRHAYLNITSPYFWDYSQFAFRTFRPAPTVQSIILAKED